MILKCSIDDQQILIKFFQFLILACRSMQRRVDSRQQGQDCDDGRGAIRQRSSLQVRLG